MRRGGVDLKMGAVMIAGGAVGSLSGAGLFRCSRARPDRPGDRLSLRPAAGGIGGLMLKDALVALGWLKVESRRSGRATTAGSPACRCAGASMRRAFTCRRSRRWRSASWPGC
jgi:hypothetical protein